MKKWVRQDHFHYNFKDYRQYQHHQDGDLVWTIKTVTYYLSRETNVKTQTSIINLELLLR